MIVVRPERPGDEAAIRRVLEAAFPGPGEARLVETLRGAGKLPAALVAEDDGEIIGHVAFSPLRVDGVAHSGVGLAPLAVVPPRQRQGVGGRLVREGLAACAAAGFGFVVLLGHPEYYPRFGFEPASRRGWTGEYGGHDAFMVLELVPGAAPPGPVFVRYAEEFAALSE